MKHAYQEGFDEKSREPCLRPPTDSGAVAGGSAPMSARTLTRRVIPLALNGVVPRWICSVAGILSRAARTRRCHCTLPLGSRFQKHSRRYCQSCEMVARRWATGTVRGEPGGWRSPRSRRFHRWREPRYPRNPLLACRRRICQLACRRTYLQVHDCASRSSRSKVEHASCARMTRARAPSRNKAENT